jgi:hypothetical protein
VTGSAARTLVIVVVGIALLGGCGRHPPARQTGGGIRQLKRSEMTPAEVKYGIAPIPDATVTYQPDVIVVSGGGDAIRAQSTNGFIWTIDAKAPHAAELAPGKIFFMTNRAVGRVLDVRPEGANLVVVVGPVNLTDVVKEAHITIDTPIDFGEAIAYGSPDLPGRVDVIALRNTADDATITPVSLTTGTDQGPAAPTTPVAPTPDVSNLVHFKVTPIVNRFGLGLEANTDAGGLKLKTEATLHIAAPKFEAHIDITPTGGVEQASLTLTGGAGLTWSFAAGTDVGRRANVNGILTPDTDFSIPLYGIGPLPFALTVRQRLVVKTALGVRNTTLSARGNYTFDGAFTVGVVNRKWSIGGPTNFSAEQNMMKTAEGISLGAAGIDLADEVKVIAGIGVHGFAAGPYFRVTSALGVFKGSSMGMLECKEATINVKLSGGVGYVIPKVVTNIFNAILSGLNIKYRITGEGGFDSGAPATLYSATSTMKGCNAGKE